jgi:hypothetical protein
MTVGETFRLLQVKVLTSSPTDRLLFYRISSTHTLIQNTISVNPYISLSLSATLPPSRNNSSTTLPLTNHQIQISIPNPFKAKSSPKLDVPTELSNPIGRISLGESKVSGTLDMKEVVEGMELRKVEAKTEKLSFVGAVWSSERVLVREERLIEFFESTPDVRIVVVFD